MPFFEAAFEFLPEFIEGLEAVGGGTEAMGGLESLGITEAGAGALGAGATVEGLAAAEAAAAGAGAGAAATEAGAAGAGAGAGAGAVGAGAPEALATGGMSLAPGAFEGIGSSLIPGGASTVPAGLTAAGGGAAIPGAAAVGGALGGALPGAVGAGASQSAVDAPLAGSSGPTPGVPDAPAPPPEAPPPGTEQAGAGRGVGPQGVYGGPPEAPSGLSKALQSLGLTDATGGLGRNALPALGLGLGQLNASNSSKSLSKQLTKAGAPAASAADSLLSQGLSGQAPEAVIAQANQTYQNGVEAIKQQYANMGRDPNTDTGALAAIAKLAVQRDAQIQQYASTLTGQGLQAAQIAQSPATQAALAAAQQDQQLAQAQASVLKQLAHLQSMQGAGALAPAAA